MRGFGGQGRPLPLAAGLLARISASPWLGAAAEVWLKEGHWLRGRFLGKVGEWICEDDSS